MSNIYILLGPPFFLALFKRTRKIVRSVKNKDSDGIKVNTLFLVLIIAVGIMLVFYIRHMDR